MSAPETIRLHIERLIVDESLVSRGQAGALQRAVETELSRLFAETTLAGLSHSAVAHLDAGGIRVAPGTRPTHLGQQIARSIHGALGSQGQTPIPRESSAKGGVA
jgi:hypothetical protein